MNLALPYAPIPENALKLAKTIIEPSAKFNKLDLDYSMESLQDVDYIIENFREEGVSVERIASTLFCFGCYVGEVFLRAQGGSWKKVTETNARHLSGMPLVIETADGEIENPIGNVFKRYKNGQADSIAHLYQVIAYRN